jgi:hypothetical protein
LSDVPGVTEELYIHVFPNPPNNVGIVDDSWKNLLTHTPIIPGSGKS